MLNYGCVNISVVESMMMDNKRKRLIMKKNVLMITLFAVCMFVTVNAADIKLDTAKLKEIKESTKVLQKPNFQIVNGIDKGSIYFLKVKATSKRGSRIFETFVDKQTGIVYFGSAFDKEGKPLMFPKDTKIIKEGISFSYGTGKKEIYLVTDPECSYCNKFEKAAEGKMNDYTVHVIFYPLPFHKKAPAMVEWIMQGKSDAEKKERLSQIALKNSTEYQTLIKDTKKPFKYSTETQKSVDRSLKAVQELGTRGTPSTYDEKFNKIPWAELVKK